jgi:RHS repeat-associated protein
MTIIRSVMSMPGRKYTAGSGYRYGFNGKEKDIAGEGNAYDFGARVYDSRVSKWLSTDPLQTKYPGLSPYQFCANSPISSKDPDGRLIIFINGLWGWPNGVGGGGTPNYWGPDWIERVQDKIGDHASPRFYDGSLGGTAALAFYKSMSNDAGIRIKRGHDIGYSDAASIISKLDKGETIKIVTNSMGTAFARGFTKGILKYQAEENIRRTTFNKNIDEQIAMLETENLVISTSIKTKANPIPQITNYTAGERKALGQIGGNNTKIAELQAKKKEMLNVIFESEIDLSSHQIDYPNEDVYKNYYMIARPENMKLETRMGVKQKSIRGSLKLGEMSVHHSSGAEPENMPASSYPDPKPKSSNP